MKHAEIGTDEIGNMKINHDRKKEDQLAEVSNYSRSSKGTMMPFSI